MTEQGPPSEPLMRQKDAALLLGVSVAYLRNSRCPKVLLPGNGPKGRPIVRYDPADLEAFKQEYLVGRQKAS